MILVFVWFTVRASSGRIWLAGPGAAVGPVQRVTGASDNLQIGGILPLCLKVESRSCRPTALIYVDVEKCWTKALPHPPFLCK